jgi:hypothetical protein
LAKSARLYVAGRRRKKSGSGDKPSKCRAITTPFGQCDRSARRLPPAHQRLVGHDAHQPDGKLGFAAKGADNWFLYHALKKRGFAERSERLRTSLADGARDFPWSGLLVDMC